jgi:hypothetical protein
MPTPGQELSSIDFESMLGGPLSAVINAQAQSAITTVNFIKEVGFKKGEDADQSPEGTTTSDPIYVKFKYPKEIAPYQPEVKNEAGDVTTAQSPAKYETQVLEVPILTILPIPYIRIDETTIDFNAKINSISWRQTDTNFKIASSLEAKAGWLWGSAKLKVSCSYQRNTQQGSKVTRTYSLAIHIKAVQDEIPAGMERMLGILEDAIISTPASAPAPVIT